jgi:conjugative relaxase-like TrwC/TraI family protein
MTNQIRPIADRLVTAIMACAKPPLRLTKYSRACSAVAMNGGSPDEDAMSDVNSSTIVTMPTTPVLRIIVVHRSKLVSISTVIIITLPGRKQTKRLQAGLTVGGARLALTAERLISSVALAVKSAAKSSRYSASSTPPLNPVMSQTAALPSDVPPQTLKLRVEHTPCTAGNNSGRPDRESVMYPLRASVTMSLHKLTAGSGYDYLTRQVAALDATEKGHTGLASYYTERGETPGVWIGSGIDGIDGLTAGDPVTAEQMRALFGCGLHPLAELRQQQLEGPDLTTRDFQEVVQLGAPFKIFDGGVSPFRLEVARRFAVINTAAGLPAGTHLPTADRARVRTEVAREFFLAAHGRESIDAPELAGQIAKQSRPPTQTVAGYDLTFSPVKSVSTLWAVAEPAVAAVIEQAHQAAVKDALAFIEKHALFTRTGPQGIRQVNVRGLVATAFTHRDSRAGDPDLHTHVAVANKVQTLDGRWLSIDGRVLFKANVATSETYNTALEQHLRERLGVRFAERPGTDPAKREIVGVDPRLNHRWSTRRAHIEARRGELAIRFQDDHGRPPTPVEALHLAQQATLETRDAKHEPRSLAEQRATWLGEAGAVLGSSEAVASMVRTALTPLAETATTVDAGWVTQTASRIVAVMEESRSTWQMWHVRAEAQRQLRKANVPAERAGVLVDLLVDEVLDRRSIALAAHDQIEEPETLRRVDGSSVYTVAGAELYTSQRILDAEQRLLTTAGRRDGASAHPTAVDLALLEMAANGTALDMGQACLVRQMCTSGARLQLAIAPAGAGKTTAMRALTLAWTEDGGQVIGLAPSAAAAAVLGEQTGIRADTLAKLTWSLDHGGLLDWMAAVGPATLIIIDEAGMADTLSLDTAVRFAIARGASVRLIGDDQQLAAIGAGGVLRDIKNIHGALQLTELHRFTDPAEAQALARPAGRRSRRTRLLSRSWPCSCR